MTEETEYVNQEALQALDETVSNLMQSEISLAEMSNSIGVILTHLDAEEANPQVQELLESAIAAINSVTEQLKAVVEEKTELQKDEQ